MWWFVAISVFKHEAPKCKKGISPLFACAAFVVVPIFCLFVCLHFIINLLFLPGKSFYFCINQGLAVSDRCHFGWYMFICKLLTHFAEMFSQVINFGILIF